MNLCPSRSTAELDDARLLRYSRHILLDEIGVEGQEKIAAAHALVIGAGGLGSPVALYLAASGIGTLTIVDDDVVDLTNLQRQILHTADRIGQNKAQSAARTLSALNPEARVNPVSVRATGEQLLELVGTADVVIDCCDNFATRHAVNRACFSLGKPLVSGAATRFEGQLTVFDPRQPHSPCYHCLFGEEGEQGDGPCATFGVFAPLVGIVGSMQAAEALKLVMGIGESPVGRLLQLDAMTLRWRESRFGQDPDCPVCTRA
ncbi:adenylyltransferase and sulfurtransferase [Formivibrio citricus]|uniref:Adenylyltransferase and sulfurtransferase n=1 Tax=Formivibrio citricus TaxID=83765 RepID=A0A1I5D201_9NEIS|nr:HesA/MoeB/ThiF family protein [Formivibrio citricus]SFN93239.1 adenylyltransferase and sulfurtransferase [Formivibrio citricus]